jgi:ribosomal protein S18 acetylase RimI-like enzyme
VVAASLERFRAADFTHAMIGVDTDNTTGAAGLYRRLGFEPVHRSVAYERRLTP